MEAEPFSDEAMLFTKELVLQREVSAFYVAVVTGRRSARPVPGRLHPVPGWSACRRRFPSVRATPFRF